MILGDGVEISDNYSFFVKPNLYDITNKQLKEKEEVSELLNWGRRNPVLFAEEMYGIELMDYQKYVFMMSWNTPNVVWCMSRNSGKTMLGSIFIMTKTLLIPNHKSYILCGVGSQSVEMFTKIEQFVNNQNPSFTTLTDFYKGELQKNAANKTGFVHNPASYKYSLYNDSQVFTLNGAYDNNRSSDDLGLYNLLQK